MAENRKFITKPTATFTRSASKFYNLTEVVEMTRRLELDPAIGKPLDIPTGALLGVPHPKVGKSSKGFKPVVIYCVSEPDSVIVLIDVVEDISTLRKWLSNPKNVETLSSYGKVIVRVIWEIIASG